MYNSLSDEYCLNDKYNTEHFFVTYLWRVGSWGRGDIRMLGSMGITKNIGGKWCRSENEKKVISLWMKPMPFVCYIAYLHSEVVAHTDLVLENNNHKTV